MEGGEVISQAATKFWGTISTVVGWTYFFCWSISFYPQVWLNFKRKSVVGLSLDFVAYNLLGFFCYAAFSIAAYPKAARINDVSFAGHAFTLCVITAAQTLMYDRGGNVLSKTCKNVISGTVLLISGFVVGVVLVDNNFFSLYNLLYLLSFVKLFVSVVKYVPQVLLNKSRRSTVGWNIWNVILDFSGGIFSLLQILIDGLSSGQWSAVTENPVKFLLGLTSIGFDIIFIAQHVAYGKKAAYQPLKV
eukprot:Plantae.Rhodophyta-Purpureofilum_apyrenoidigerum.ctg14292.p1 GENE.Plantae.Rhodophyta-Purpureofilum_apyrenoidigerum.ctg14292~~Plantae.Rhodophyta-Purpureofilum_apyrenoidigerum.ctg14292.p1  ORF type:complete len:247 (-),score=42.41 Plantae.Rhodophyta-Purpureofilum_apyrenoidigerum.ctg14292:514-1254(-)